MSWAKSGDSNDSGNQFEWLWELIRMMLGIGLKLSDLIRMTLGIDSNGFGSSATRFEWLWELIRMSLEAIWLFQNFSSRILSRIFCQILSRIFCRIRSNPSDRLISEVYFFSVSNSCLGRAIEWNELPVILLNMKEFEWLDMIRIILRNLWNDESRFIQRSKYTVYYLQI